MLNLAKTAKPVANIVCESARQVYFSLNGSEPGDTEHRYAGEYLHAQLANAHTLPTDLPATPAQLDQWLISRAQIVGDQYRDYLAARKAGAARRFFGSRSHALYFLQAVAPTKLVDGAWLYGMLARWKDADYLPLIRTYLEELGDGVPGQNHVVLYKKLLAVHGCEQWRNLGDAHFVQGAIQLSLAHQAEHFLPEIIGYNLGYEQLPLHLLITAYELNELGIDPYYFTLHITIDNAATGHAHKALASVKQLQPLVGNVDEFYRRVRDGYRLNDLGASTMSVIQSFDLEQEVIGILKKKATVGKNMHSDYCRVAGRTVNDWLSDPAQMSGFLAALVDAGWIKRGEPAESSRFWRLIHGERAEMFGVFSEYEQQMLRDWIASPLADQNHASPGSGKSMTVARIPSFRAQQRSMASLHEKNSGAGQVPSIGAARGVIRQQHEQENDDFTVELRLLEQRIASLNSKDAVMRTLIKLMSPAHHHIPAGLMATRMLTKLLA